MRDTKHLGDWRFLLSAVRWVTWLITMIYNSILIPPWALWWRQERAGCHTSGWLPAGLGEGRDNIQQRVSVTQRAAGEVLGEARKTRKAEPPAGSWQWVCWCRHCPLNLTSMSGTELGAGSEEGILHLVHVAFATKLVWLVHLLAPAASAVDDRVSYVHLKTT